MQENIEIFISYAPEDDKYRKELKISLAQLKNQGVITWDDHDIPPGAEREYEIDTHLATARIILLLISQTYIDSKSSEMMDTMQQRKKRKAPVIPINIHPVTSKEQPFEKLEALPKGGQPIDTWRNREAAWVNVVEEIRQIVQKLPDGDSVWADFVQRSRRRTDAFFQNIEHSPRLLGSFDPELYVQRIEIEDTLSKFLMGNDRALILVGDSGVGKTHVLCA